MGSAPLAKMGFRRSTPMADRGCSGRSTAALIAESTRPGQTCTVPGQVLPSRWRRTWLAAGARAG